MSKDSTFDTKELLQTIITKIEQNVCSDNIEELNKYFYQNNYMNLIKAMILFGESKFEESMSILNSESGSILKIGASDEQLLILIEIELYCSYKCKDLVNFNKILHEKYGENYKKVNYIQRFYCKLKSENTL